MNDPRLNSVHLELDPRRQQYRRAREELLAARGWKTLALEKINDRADDSDVLSTMPPNRSDQNLPGTNFVLMEPSTRQTYLLRPGMNTIGRLPDNDIVLEDVCISRRHCVLLVHAGGQCELHDTASRNGTFVNGQRIVKPACLHRGDEILVYRRRLLFIGESDCRSDDPSNDNPETALLD